LRFSIWKRESQQMLSLPPHDDFRLRRLLCGKAPNL